MPTTPTSSSATSTSRKATAAPRSAASISTNGRDGPGSQARQRCGNRRGRGRRGPASREDEKAQAPRHRRPGHEVLGRRHGQGPRPGRSLRPRPARLRRLAALPGRRRRRPLHRTLQRVQPFGQDLRSLSRSEIVPDSARRSVPRGDSRPAAAGLARPAGPRSQPPRGQGHPRVGGAAGQAGQTAGKGESPPRGRGPLPHALPVHHVRRGRGTDPPRVVQGPAGRAARRPGEFQAGGRGPVADDEHGRILAHPAEATAPLQRRAVCRKRCPAAHPADAGACCTRRPAADWTDVEPAIFGTLLERALSPVERHKLGAHYTPRAYVERLVLPTVIEPLREDWQAAFAAAVTAARQGDLAAAQETVRGLSRTTLQNHGCWTQPAAAAISSTSRWNR